MSGREESEDALWLTIHGDTARWTLLTIMLPGGFPLLWETVRQFFHKEFSFVKPRGKGLPKNVDKDRGLKVRGS